MALKVNEIVKVEVEASDGQVLKEGDAIMLRVSRRTPEDVVCRFAGLSNGYFVTTTLDGQHENKYRQASEGMRREIRQATRARMRGRVVYMTRKEIKEVIG